ncbi:MULTISPECIES: hypothetical protein [unclassified Campylobacter]|uniref:hypothetical protein n=1 Tax=unclassified Campylobacter TaxID=2593542 RepID=UPI001BD9F7CF|nr:MULTISPECIES: hypothetical protein [unclassified Campylobacter]MBT0880626.1 hypothetical protein [Campylobacter sp. 2018MI27]MBT0882734.1 hypothetical protein [Campylobacter sp. 2018MI13]MBT0884359.1 hypothetical protein [Campylobacter sp. 2018MI10]
MRFFIISLIINIVALTIPLSTEEIIIDNKKINIEIIETKKEDFVNNQKILQEEIFNQQNNLSEQVIQKEINIKNTNLKANKKVKIKKEAKQDTKSTSNTANENKEETKENLITNNQINMVKEYPKNINSQFCKSNIIFNELDNSYPKKAKMLKLERISKVSVRFSISNSGINILSITGNDFFANHTKKLILDMKYKILDKQALGCVFLKNIEYRMN